MLRIAGPACRARGRGAVYARAEKALATSHAYRSDFGLFRGWYEAKGVIALPASAESAAAFLACEVERGIRPTIGRRVAAIWVEPRGDAMRRAGDVRLRVVPLVLSMRNLAGDVVDAIVGGGAADLIASVHGEPCRPREQRGWQALVADGRAQLGDGERALLVLRDVLLAGPDDLDGFADLPGDLGRLPS